jgi:hypothetical protein
MNLLENIVRFIWNILRDYNSILLIHKFFCATLFVTPLHRSKLQNATISKMKSGNFNTLQKRA